MLKDLYFKRIFMTFLGSFKGSMMKVITLKMTGLKMRPILHFYFMSVEDG